MSCPDWCAGNCGSCGVGDKQPRSLQLVRDTASCGPGCGRCAQLRQMLGDGPFSRMAYTSFKPSITMVLQACPTGALTLIEL